MGALLVGLVSWFGWMSFDQSKTQSVDTKVKQAMSAGCQSLVPAWPRIETRSNISPDDYYSPMINNPAQTFQLYRHMLEYLNQDSSVPPVKISQVSMRIEYGSSEDNLIIQARVEFSLILGIEKVFTTQNAFKIPHFNTLR